ncbi:hypothetical protein FAI41_06330 [Acetobacteraceae bacterium]|nr:hypothetical protein FAI41_06330 [Acetobacteraceae bacterium]
MLTSIKTDIMIIKGLKMEALIQNKFGKPEEVFLTQKMRKPQPKENEVLIKTLLSPLHHHDLSAAKGLYGQFRPFPIISGSEAVGIVEACGKQVTDFKIGQRVITASGAGTWAEYFTAPADSVFPVSEGLKAEQAAQLAAMPLSALLLLNFLEVQKGDWIIQNGANGVIGKILGALAKARGIHVVNLVRSAKASAELKKAGAEYIVETSAKDWKAQAKEIAGDMLKAGIDVLGGEASGNLVELLGNDSLLVSFGQIACGEMKIPSGPLILKSITLKGFYVTPVLNKMSKGEKIKILEELEALILAGKLSLPVESIHDLDHFQEALTAHNQQGRAGRVLLKV